MARLIYSSLTSLDGYTTDPDGSFTWAAPSEEVHRFVNQLESSIGTYLYGRRMYEVMSEWQTIDHSADLGEAAGEYASIWRSADKVVYSSNLAPSVTNPRTRVERAFDVDEVSGLVAKAAQDVSIGGPTLAAHALRGGLVDDIHLFMLPVAVGGGLPWWPVGLKHRFYLHGHDHFTDGTVHLHYQRWH